VSSLKSHWAEILVARRVEEVEREPLMLEVHHRRGNRDAALALDRHPTRAHPPPLARALASPAHWIGPPNSISFLGYMVFPASGGEMIAKVRRRAISSVRVLVNRLFSCGRATGHRWQAVPLRGRRSLY